MRIIANYPLPLSTCRARAGEPVGLLLYPSLASKSYLITTSPGFYRRAEGPTYRPASLASGSLRRRRGSLVLGKPRRKLRISSRAAPRTSNFQSREIESRAAELRTSNFRAANFESSAAELRTSNFQSRAVTAELRTSNPASQLRRRAANFEFPVPRNTYPSRQAAKFESSPRAVNFKFQSREYVFPRSLR